MSRKKTHEEYVAQVNEVNPHIEVTGIYINNKCDMSYMCKRCGFKDHARAEHLSDRYRQCRNCEGNGHITYGVNDFYTVKPDFAKYMEDQELAHKIGANSHKNVWFVCPDCNTRFVNKPCNVVKNGLSCPSCSSGRRYPNKFMFNVLRSSGIDFENEFSDTWTEKYLYDFMFVRDGNRYIVEMDGAFHFQYNSITKTPVEDAMSIDKYKTELAINNGYHLIRIDCNYTNVGERYTYIKNNILNSELSELIDFSMIDFDLCDILSQKSDFIYICELYDSGIHDVHEICKLIGLCYESVITHLKHSEELGCSTYRHDDALCERNEMRKNKVAKSNGQLLYCNDTNEIFYSIVSAKRCYGGRIDAYLKGETDYAGILDDGTKLHYIKISQEEANMLIANNGAKFISVDFNRDNGSQDLRRLKRIVVCNQTNEWFANRSIANKKYHASITYYLTGKTTYAGMLDNGIKLTWYVPTIDEINSYINSGGIIIDKTI